MEDSSSVPCRGNKNTLASRQLLDESDRHQAFSVFKVNVVPSAFHQSETVLHTRKAHRKSKNGCFECKSRRLKCDEARPYCSRCVRAQKSCMYPAVENIATSESVAHVPQPTAAVQKMAVDLFDSQLHDLLGTIYHRQNSSISDEVRLLQHFNSMSYFTPGEELSQDALQKTVATQGWTNSHVVRMAIAVAAAHMKRITLLPRDSPMFRKYSRIEIEHGSAGVQSFRGLLTGHKPLDFDAGVATTFLTTMFSASMWDEFLEYNAIYDSEAALKAVCDPLSSLQGFRALRVGGYLRIPDPSTSAFLSVLETADDGHGTFDSAEPGIEGLPVALAQLCELDENSTSEQSHYHAILRRLTPLFLTEINVQNSNKFVAFLGRSWMEFQPLLARKDPRGLLLLAYWFASMRHLPIWWLRPHLRAQVLVTYLRSLHDENISLLLLYPESFGRAGLEKIWLPLDDLREQASSPLSMTDEEVTFRDEPKAVMPPQYSNILPDYTRCFKGCEVTTEDFSHRPGCQ